MKSLVICCECGCGSLQFHLRLKREEQVGLLTCDAGHHSLLLDSRDYWADILTDGGPKQSRCRCGGTLFRLTLEYEFRDDGEVRTVLIKPTCSDCGREQTPAWVEIKYAPRTEQSSFGHSFLVHFARPSVAQQTQHFCNIVRASAFMLHDRHS
jgi:hypothetical protein